MIHITNMAMGAIYHVKIHDTNIEYIFRFLRYTQASFINASEFLCIRNGKEDFVKGNAEIGRITQCVEFRVATQAETQQFYKMRTGTPTNDYTLI